MIGETLCLSPQAAHLSHHPAIDNVYSKVEIGVLQLAAEILRVSVDDLARLTHAGFVALTQAHEHVIPPAVASAPMTTSFDGGVLSTPSVGAHLTGAPPPPVVHHEMPQAAPMGIMPINVEPVINNPNSIPAHQQQAPFMWAHPAAPDQYAAALNNSWQQEYYAGSDTSTDTDSFPNSRRSSLDDPVTTQAPVLPVNQYPIYAPVAPDMTNPMHPGMTSVVNQQLAVQDYAMPTESHTHGFVTPMETPVETHDIKYDEPARMVKPRLSNPNSQIAHSPLSAGVNPPYRKFRAKKTQTAALSRTRSAFEPEQRQRTALIRKLKACIRCHLQKEGCGLNPDNPDGPCPRCMRLQGPNSTGLPCLRYKISEAQLLDKGAHPRFSWTRRFTSMSIVGISDEGWRSPELKTITLTQDVGVNQIATYQMQVREFIPVPGDSLARSWHSSNGPRSHPCTPYAIADVHSAASVITTFVDQHTSNFIEFYIDEADQLMRRTYVMAYRHSRFAARKEERELLKSVLRLWVASRMESKQERICGHEFLGMQAQYSDPDATNYGNYLVPPVMQAQIELLTTAAILLPEKENILKCLESFMKPNQPQNWFTIYLALFILLHSCALLTQAEYKRAAREGFIGPNPRYHDSRLVEEIHNGARTLLAYFHFCNKGNQPFKIDWANPPNLPFAALDADQVQFMKETVGHVMHRHDKFVQIKQENNYEDDYYFISQLYETEWRPVHTV